MSVKIRPLGDRVVVQPKPVEEKTQGGILLPSKSDEKVLEGIVMAVGPGRLSDAKRQDIEIKVGEVVIFNQYAGTEVKHEGESYTVLREDDILAVVEGERT